MGLCFFLLPATKELGISFFFLLAFFCLCHGTRYSTYASEMSQPGSS